MNASFNLGRTLLQCVIDCAYQPKQRLNVSCTTFSTCVVH